MKRTKKYFETQKEREAWITFMMQPSTICVILFLLCGLATVIFAIAGNLSGTTAASIGLLVTWAGVKLLP